MTRALHTLIQYLRQNIGRSGDAALTDAELLERWIGQRDPAAFELLLWRHGPMVLNTCRRLLRRSEDVEDAFQATFLVLVRKAGSIRRGEALAAWLHRTACRIAGRARAAEDRRTSREQPFADEPDAPALDVPALRDLHTILDEEIESLPAHYRRALILCCLEGKSQQEAARILGRPRGTVSSWLTRGRERLRQRLLRRGILVSIAGLTAALTPDALTSGGVIPLVGSLIRTAGAFSAGGTVPAGLLSARTLALAEGVLRMMFMTKVKIVAAVCLAVTVAAAGVGTWSHTTRAGDDPPVLQQEIKQSQENGKIRKWYIGSDAFTPPEHNKRAEDGIAWGEKVHGLQAGIGFRRGDQESYEVGQSVTFVLYLRKVSGSNINLSSIDPVFDGWRPMVQDAEGRHLAVAPGPIQPGGVPIVQRELISGTQIILGYPWFRIRPPGWHGEVPGPTCCAEPGRYKVGYTGFLRLNGGTEIRLSTKQVELDIRRQESAKGEGTTKKAPLMKRPAISPIGEAEKTPLYYCLSRSFNIPVIGDPQRCNSVQELVLSVSGNQGQTWERVSKKTSNGSAFSFRAPGDGMYWFVVQEVDKQGRCKPADLSRAKPSIRICVDTTPPVVTLQARREKNTLVFSWTAEDDNLDDKPVRQIECGSSKDGPWGEFILCGPLPKSDHYTWDLPELPKGITRESDMYFRIQVRDKAGNDGYAVAYIKLE